MAKEGYWDDQFNQALPVFLANWYASAFLEEIEKSCENEGVSSLLSFTNGYYKTDMVGEWIVKHTNAVNKVLDLLEEGAARGDLIHRALRSRLAFTGILGRGRNPHGIDFNKYPEHLHREMAHALGKKIQKTAWWKNNAKRIKQGSRSILAVKKVMEC
jgi:hypothetical protein